MSVADAYRGDVFPTGKNGASLLYVAIAGSCPTSYLVRRSVNKSAVPWVDTDCAFVFNGHAETRHVQNSMCGNLREMHVNRSSSKSIEEAGHVNITEVFTKTLTIHVSFQ